MARPTLLACLLVSACSVPNPWFGATTGDPTDTTGAPTTATTTAQPTGDAPTTGAVNQTTTTGETTDGLTVVHTSDLPSATTTTSSSPTTSSSTTDTTTTDTTTTTGETSTGNQMGEESDTNNVDLQPCNDSDPKLLACYDFENGFDEKALLFDGSMYQNHGVMEGPDYFPGIDAQALKVTETTRGTAINKPHLNPVSITMAAWVRLVVEPPASGAAIVEKPEQYSLSIGGAGLKCNVGVMFQTSDTEIPLDKWTHVACTYNDGVFRLYVDGALVKETMDDLANIGMGTNPLRVGCGGANCAFRFLGGNIDRVRLWSIALDQSAICSEAGVMMCG